MAKPYDRNELHIAITLKEERLNELKALAKEAGIPVSRLVRYRLRLSEKAPLELAPKKTKTSFRIPRPLLDRVKEQASRIGLSHCEFVTLLLEQWHLEKLRLKILKKGKLAKGI